MNIIFLDIDGVLNNFDCFHFEKNNIDMNCIRFFLETLQEIAKQQIEVKVVISLGKSSDFNSFKKFALETCGRYNKKYVNELFTWLHKDWSTKRLNSKRGKEVKEWLSRHPEVDKYLCISDKTDFLQSQPLLLTNSAIGFRHRESIITKRFFIKSNETFKDINHITQTFDSIKKINKAQNALAKSLI